MKSFGGCGSMVLTGASC